MATRWKQGLRRAVKVAFTNGSIPAFWKAGGFATTDLYVGGAVILLQSGAFFRRPRRKVGGGEDAGLVRDKEASFGNREGSRYESPVLKKSRRNVRERQLPLGGERAESHLPRLDYGEGQSYSHIVKKDRNGYYCRAAVGPRP